MNESNSQLAELVSKGATSDIYAWSENRLLKLLHPRYPREVAERECEIIRSLHATGCPAPRAYEVLELDGRFGFVLERIDGISLLQLVERKPWKLFYSARLLADLHAQVHQYTAPLNLPTQRSQLERWFAQAKDFTVRQRAAAAASLAQLPDGRTLSHGDFHPANILLLSSRTDYYRLVQPPPAAMLWWMSPAPACFLKAQISAAKPGLNGPCSWGV